MSKNFGFSIAPQVNSVIDRLDYRDDLFPLKGNSWAYSHKTLMGNVDGYRKARTALHAACHDPELSIISSKNETVEIELRSVCIATHESIAGGIGFYVIERMIESACATVGPAADGYLSDMTDAQKRQLCALLEPTIATFLERESGIRGPWFFDLIIRPVKVTVRPSEHLIESIAPIGTWSFKNLPIVRAS